MNINKLASAISRGKWLIEPRTAMVERQRAIKFLSGDFAGAAADMEEPELDKPFALKAGSYFDITDDSSDIFGVAEAGSVAILPICGTIMKYDYCGSPGTDTLSIWLKAAIDSPQIDAIVLLINSGGGSVEGTGEFADLIKGSAKTILAYCDGLMASAAYWIGSAAKEVWASHATAEFGSIGTAVCFMDDSKYMEENGFSEVYINADSSPDKNQDVLKAIAGDSTPLKENIINPTNAIFMATVKANRDGKLKLTDVEIDGKPHQEPLTGKVYLSEASIKSGLIDGICTLDAAVERALELSKTKIENKKSLNSNNMAINTEEKEKQVKKSTSLLEKIQALFASEKEEDDDKGSKNADDEEAKKAEKKGDEPDEDAKKAKKADDEEMSAGKKAEDSEDENQDESDEDDIEVNGKTYSMKDPKQAKAAIAATVAEANKIIADKDKMIGEKDELISEAAEVIKVNVAELKKTETEVKKEIKSTFTLKGSTRSSKLKIGEGEDAQSFKPAAGSYAEQVLNRALAKQKAAAKNIK